MSAARNHARPSPGDGQPSEPQKRPYLAAAVLMNHLPKIRGWEQVAAYPMLRSGRTMSDETSAHGHYRQGEHVVVLNIADGGELMAAFRPRFDATPAPNVDEAGTTTSFTKAGKLWIAEHLFRAPYPEQVIPYFSYKMHLDDQARPATPGLATKISMVLPNGIVVSAGGAKDTPPAMVRQVFDAVDRRKLLGLAPQTP